MEGKTQTKLRLRANNAETSALLKSLHQELRALAARWLRSPVRTPTLQPTALVNEAMLRLIAAESLTWQDRTHFMAVASTAMRQILIDHARKRRAKKRGGGAVRRLTIHADLQADGDDFVEVLALDDCLSRLASLSERQARVVEMRVFGGMTIEEVAEALAVSRTTVKSDWLIARAWLRREIAPTQAV